MEINRYLKPGYTAKSETAPARVEGAERAKADSAAANPAAKPGEYRLEQLQEAIRSLPDIDMEKVAAIKEALQRGEINMDSAALASLVVTYHRGSDV